MRDETQLRECIRRCFESIHGESSKTYRHFFSQSQVHDDDMNVVLQEMVDPKFSGVYFSKDPRGKEKTWIIELIEGLGEDLVSGRKTPVFITAENRAGITVPGLDTFNFEKVLALGARVREILGYEVDMEWALDQNLDVRLLQARPVTALRSLSTQAKLVEGELCASRRCILTIPFGMVRLFRSGLDFQVISHSVSGVTRSRPAMLSATHCALLATVVLPMYPLILAKILCLNVCLVAPM